jgi:hypothetical protein
MLPFDRKCSFSDTHYQNIFLKTKLLFIQPYQSYSIEFINPVRPFSDVPYFFAIFHPTIFKFWILRENYLSTKNTAGFFDPKPKSSVIELRLESSQIKVFFLSISEKQSNFFSTDITRL